MDKKPDLQLLPDHDFQLGCWGHCGKQFVSNFREVWGKIPQAETDSIIEFWATRVDEVLPRFELSNFWGPENASGQVRNNGQQMKFRQSTFASFPNKAAQWVIAHELAHVYQKVCGRTPVGEGEQENEAHANKIVTRWGFSNIVNLQIRNAIHEKGLSFDDACAGLKAGKAFDEL